MEWSSLNDQLKNIIIVIMEILVCSKLMGVIFKESGN